MGHVPGGTQHPRNGHRQGQSRSGVPTPASTRPDGKGQQPEEQQLGHGHEHRHQGQHGLFCSAFRHHPRHAEDEQRQGRQGCRQSERSPPGAARPPSPVHGRRHHQREAVQQEGVLHQHPQAQGQAHGSAGSRAGQVLGIQKQGHGQGQGQELPWHHGEVVQEIHCPRRRACPQGQQDGPPSTGQLPADAGHAGQEGCPQDPLGQPGNCYRHPPFEQCQAGQQEDNWGIVPGRRKNAPGFRRVGICQVGAGGAGLPVLACQPVTGVGRHGEESEVVVVGHYQGGAMFPAPLLRQNGGSQQGHDQDRAADLPSRPGCPVLQGSNGGERGGSPVGGHRARFLVGSARTSRACRLPSLRRRDGTPTAAGAA